MPKKVDDKFKDINELMDEDTKTNADLAGEVNKTSIITVDPKMIGKTLKEKGVKSDNFEGRDTKVTNKDASEDATGMIDGIPEQEGIYCLEIGAGQQQGEVYAIGTKLSIGRDFADLILDEPNISGLHCTFREQNGVVSVVDNGSSNGTYVDGRRIKPGRMVILDTSDKVLLGQVPLNIVFRHRDDPLINYELNADDQLSTTKTSKISGFLGMFKGKQKDDLESSYVDRPTEDVAALFNKKNKSDDSDTIQMDEEDLAQVNEEDLVPSSGNTTITAVKKPREFKFSKSNDAATITKADNKNLRFSEKDMTPSKKLLELDDGTSESFSNRRVSNKEKQKKKKQEANIKANVAMRPVRIRKKYNEVTGPVVRFMALVSDALLSFIIYQQLLDKYSHKENSMIEASWSFLQIDFLENLLQNHLKPIAGFLWSSPFSGIWKVIEANQGYLLTFLTYQALGVLVLSVTPSQFLLGFGSDRSFVWNRVGGFLRFLVTYPLGLFLIFDIPAIFKKRTFKEIITLTVLNYKRQTIGIFGRVILLPALILGYLATPFLIDETLLTEIPQGQEPQVETNFSGRTGGLYISEAMNFKTQFYTPERYLLLPSFQLTKAAGKSSIQKSLYVYDLKQLNLGTLQFLNGYKLKIFLPKMPQQNPMFVKNYPQLNRYIRIEKKGPLTSKMTEEVKKYFFDSMKISPATLLDHVLDKGPFLMGYAQVRKMALQAYVGHQTPKYLFTKFGNVDFIQFASVHNNPLLNREHSDVFLPLNALDLPGMRFSWKSYSRGLKQTNVQKDAHIFYRSLFYDVLWGINNPQQNILPAEGKKFNAFQLIDFFGKTEIGENNTKKLLDDLYHTYYDWGRLALKGDDAKLQDIILGQINSLEIAGKHLYGDQYQEFFQHLQKLKVSMVDRNNVFFNIQEDRETEQKLQDLEKSLDDLPEGVKKEIRP